jgi:hypothetical protein
MTTAGTAGQGRRREWHVRDHLIRQGWELISRSAGSRGPADLVMAHADHGIALIQVGTRSKHLGPAERERLLHAAWLCSGLPIVAILTPRQPITYWQITDAPMGHWTRWYPDEEHTDDRHHRD